MLYSIRYQAVERTKQHLQEKTREYENKLNSNKHVSLFTDNARHTVTPRIA